MTLWQNATWRAAVLGRWVALILGTLTVLFFLAFAFGEGLPRPSQLNALQKLQFLAMGLLFLGLAVAWKWEGLGGFLALAGFAGVEAVIHANTKLSVLDVPAAIGALHVLSWLRLRTDPPAGLTPWRLPWKAAMGGLSLLAAFLLLCANEIFGQPPLMTPTLDPSADLVGTWAQSLPMAVSLQIHADGSVTGTVDGATIDRARITYGRSWFGRLMRWNTDFRILGRLDGRPFSAPLMASGTMFRGSIFRSNLPAPLALTKE